MVPKVSSAPWCSFLLMWSVRDLCCLFHQDTTVYMTQYAFVYQRGSSALSSKYIASALCILNGHCVDIAPPAGVRQLDGGSQRGHMIIVWLGGKTLLCCSLWVRACSTSGYITANSDFTSISCQGLRALWWLFPELSLITCDFPLAVYNYQQSQINVKADRGSTLGLVLMPDIIIIMAFFTQPC